MTVAQPYDPASHGIRVQTHTRTLPLRVGTRASPLALAQTRAFLAELVRFCPVLRSMHVFEEHAIRTTGDAVQDRRLTDIGGKGLFAKEIHEALADGRIDFAVHSLKDLETTLPPGIVLACTLKREDARDALILGPGCAEAAARAGRVAPAGGRLDPVAPTDALAGQSAPMPTPPDRPCAVAAPPCREPLNLADPGAAFAMLPPGALIGTASVRRQAQLLHARPDLRITTLRGNVQGRLAKIGQGACDASLLALAGLRRLALADAATLVLDPAVMVPAAGQGIVGVTVRAADEELRQLLGAIEDAEASHVATAERALLAALDGSCRTPIGGYAHVLADGSLLLTGLVAREDGSFLLRRSLQGARADAARLGAALGASLRADSPADLFA